jgi:3-phosphoshikimate 1-carboxyvinyltransferase
MLLSKPDRTVVADVALDGSKSISNRALIALALAGADAAPWLTNLSTAKDTVLLDRLLRQGGDHYDAGDAGTTFRFLTAFLALQPGIQVLTGSPRMRERPIGALVAALRALGADIEYLEKDGYPPLRIGELHTPGGTPRLGVRADVSSQFLSALLLIGPYLPHGLVIVPEGALVSRPYLDMTLGVMRHFGAQAGWEGDTLVVAAGRYLPRPLAVEADWSAASYWYAMAALASHAEIRLRGLSAASWQGDAAVATLFERFGVETRFEPEHTVHLVRRGEAGGEPWRADFGPTPDLAQTLAVVCGALGVPAQFSGLETLSIKETDRIAALRAELAKVGVDIRPDRAGAGFELTGRAQWRVPPRIATYGDHRMAMAFAPLALLGPVEIENPEVVEKSYPAFWRHLERAGFTLGYAGF